MTILKGKKNWYRGLAIKVLFTILLGLVLNVPPGLGEIFKWVDDKGTVHFTEDPATIPEKYREKVKSRATEEDLMSPEDRIRAKEREEENAKIQRAREKEEYERSIKEEQERLRKKKAESETYEKSLRAGEGEKTRKSVEVESPGKSEQKEPQKQRLVKCSSCMGGYIKCRVCNGKGGRYITQTTYSKCSSCRGTGREECTVCGGKGVFLR